MTFLNYLPFSRIASCVRTAGMITWRLHLTWPCYVVLGGFWSGSCVVCEELCQLGLLIPKYNSPRVTYSGSIIPFYSEFLPDKSCHKWDSIHQDRESSVIRPLHYLQATMAGWSGDLLWHNYRCYIVNGWINILLVGSR